MQRCDRCWRLTKPLTVCGWYLCPECLKDTPLFRYDGNVDNLAVVLHRWVYATDRYVTEYNTNPYMLALPPA